MTSLQIINEFLVASKIKGSAIDLEIGLRGIKYYIKLALGERVAKLRVLQEELALITQSISIPDIYLDSQAGLVVVESITTKNLEPISLESLSSSVDVGNYTLPLILGKDMSNNTTTIDLVDCPHILIGGTTGSGKSVLLQSIICSLLTKPISSNDLKFILLDPKGTEMNHLKSLPHTLKYVDSFEQAFKAIQMVELLMEERYRHNSLDPESRGNFPFLVVVIDELADLLLQDKHKTFKSTLVRILQKCRAAKIHVIAATQRPSRNIIDGLIRANLPTQIALKTSSALDSRIIIDSAGAEKLVGHGDMLLSFNGKISRIQGAVAGKQLTFNRSA